MEQPKVVLASVLLVLLIMVSNASTLPSGNPTLDQAGCQRPPACCANHPCITNCDPNNEERVSACNNFCLTGNCRGGFCKKEGGKNLCHCYC